MMLLTALRHRPHSERRVLLLLRGGLPATAPSRRSVNSPEPTPAHLRRFADLRRAAVGYGLVIQPADRPYVGEDELRVLTWLAEAQRIAGPDTAPNSPDLRAALLACAGLLDGLGVRLSPLTLFGARLRQLTA